MSSQEIHDYIDDHSFDSRPFAAAANDPTEPPNLPPEEGRGDHFQPFNIEDRDFQINPLPQQPLELFQRFVPISLVRSWVGYTEDWASFCALNGVIDSWNTPLSDHSRLNAWEGISIAQAYVWLDECMVPFTGRSKETTLVKGKPTPMGFKVWVIAQQGYFLQWLWHVKASPVTAITVKLEAPTPYGKKGKLRTEIPLSNTQSLGHGATGTARPNCGITTVMKQIKETGKKPDGMPLVYNKVYLIPTKDKQVLQIAWKDSSVVLFLTTVHSEAPLNRTPKKRKLPAKRGTKAEAQRLKEVFNGDQARIIPIPSVAAQYNDEMNHVDRGDQIRSYTSYQHRFRRGPWQALLWSFLLDVALANSFILQKKTRQPRWKPYSTLRDWKEAIYNAIFIKS
ncbi:uncharacterized protein FRV6_02724 [Fusarium oxysporum]|uniref:PiggyBac transposable element-derived protein domain-containing protein n=1 Tax=Fusarium oxysporum TaxID=5507 RepID=A0A2H3SQS6_FUSOX|nr:uncharacterized protein FRV6_02724 [Fusarium oxysporum]